MGYVIVGCGLTGAVIARNLADRGENVTIYERRKHIGGNMFDYVDSHGILVQKYGPHIFHTKERELYNYICRFEEWKDYRLICGASWNGKYTSTPFNFNTIDIFYPKEHAEKLKEKLKKAFPDKTAVPVMELMRYPDTDIQEYATYLFENDYAPYTAKQWGVSPEDIDKSILERVPVRLSYEEGYFDDEYQVMPAHSFTKFFQNMLNRSRIDIKLGIDAKSIINVKDNMIYFGTQRTNDIVIFTGALDELFDRIYGELPYRSLRFEWNYKEVDSFQEAPVVAYPKEKYTRITEYKKLPTQDKKGTSYAIEYPLQYEKNSSMEPYYPVLTEESKILYEKYKMLADRIKNLIYCGRLADFKYYNMDQALYRALQVCKNL